MTPEEKDEVQEEWFGPLIDAEPEELAKSLFFKADKPKSAKLKSTVVPRPNH